MPRRQTATPAAQEREGQQTLIVDTPPRGVSTTVRTDSINPVPAHPEDAFVDNVQRLGILQPVALIRDRPQGTRWNIADGRRRVATANRLDIEEIPALCFPPGTSPAVAAAIALSANLQRAPNPVGEYEAIQQMVRDGFPLAQIREQLRLDQTTITRRMKLANLLSGLLEALAEDKFALTVAEKLASMPHDIQALALARLNAGQRLTAALVNSLRTQAEPPQSGMDLGDDDEPAERSSTSVVIEDDGWAGVLAALAAAEEKVPPNPDDATGRVLTAIATLRSQVERMAAAA